MRVAVIGAGVSGLAAALKLLELKEKHRDALQVVLYEASGRAGGTIETENRDGFILEKGPDSFISEKPWALTLAEKLGLGPEIIGTNERFRKSFIVRNRKLLALPQGFYLIAPMNPAAFLASPIFSLKGKLRMMMEPWISVKNDTNESVASFIRRRFGDEALERAGQAMVAGIYTGDPEKLGISAALPRFKELEKKYGSVIRGLKRESKGKKGSLADARGPRYSLFLSFRKGMQTLPDEMKKRIAKESLRLNSPVDGLRFDSQGKKWHLSLKNGAEEVFDAVFLTVSADHTARLLGPTAPSVARKLGDILYESVATVNIAYRRQDVSHPLDGFGFVVPRLENSPLVACSFSGTKFEHRAPQGFVLLRAFVGGAFGRKIFEKDDAALVRSVEQELSQLLGIGNKPLFSAVSRYPRSMVQYGVNHPEIVRSIEEDSRNFKGLFLTGSAYRGVGIPDCIHDAETQVQTFWSQFHETREHRASHD